MRAVAHDRYGPLQMLQLEKVERPTPKEGEALSFVSACSPGLRSA